MFFNQHSQAFVLLLLTTRYAAPANVSQHALLSSMTTVDDVLLIASKQIVVSRRSSERNETAANDVISSYCDAAIEECRFSMTTALRNSTVFPCL